MKHFSLAVICALALTFDVPAQTTPDAAELTRLLREFLAGASRNDAATHDRFWAEDLIYTGSAGRRIGKADIMRDQRSTSARRLDAPTVTYSAEDIRIQQYGSTAIVAFRLVATTRMDGRTQITNYLNTGTFLKRNGKWQAVSWQATKMPRPEEDVRSEVTATSAALQQALLDGETKKLEGLADESFVWTDGSGEQATRQQLIEQLRSGRLRYSKLETDKVIMSVYSDAAVLRGVWLAQRSAIPNAKAGDATPFTTFFTLTFINKGGDWRPVAMHTSCP